MRRARKKESKLKKRLLIFFASFFSVLLMFVVALGFHGVWLPYLMPEEGQAIDEDYVEPVDKATGKANILILGVDKDGLRTDVIIVASYDLDNNAINMLNIPRDTRMYIGSRYQKINAAHSLTQNGKIKGPQGTIEAVTRITGIPINYYVEFSFDAFKKTIDALGGVDFDVPQRMKYSDPAQDLYIDLQPGFQHLDGDKAEQFVRFRKYPLGDIARVEAQQNFIKALAEQKLNLSIVTKIPDLYKTLQDEVVTNFTIMDVMKYIPNIKELSAESICTYQLPGSFSGAEYSASYWLPNMTELKTLISDVFGYDSSEITADPIGKTVAATDKTASSKADTGTASASDSKSTSAKKPSSNSAATPVPKATSAPAETNAPKSTQEPKATQPPEAASAPTPAATKAPSADSDSNQTGGAAGTGEETKSEKKVYGESILGKNSNSQNTAPEGESDT